MQLRIQQRAVGELQLAENRGLLQGDLFKPVFFGATIRGVDVLVWEGEITQQIFYVYKSSINVSTGKIFGFDTQKKTSIQKTAEKTYNIA